MKQGGYTANMNGKALEKMVADRLKAEGFEELTDKEKKQFVSTDGEFPEGKKRWFARQIRLDRNLYEAKYVIDFFVYDEKRFPEGLQIETKWQSSSGSVDEKYVFTVKSMLLLRGEKILILDGGGARPGAIKWIKSQERGRKGRFKMFSISGFMSWANEHLRE